LELEKPNADNLNIISDNCRGHGKNWAITALERSLVTHVFRSVEHWFPQVGHTRLSCDRDFGRIEKCQEIESLLCIHLKNEFHSLRETCKTNPFVVTKMKQEDFKDLQSLHKNITKKHKCDDGTPCTF
jgi:hypothetical protein